MLTALLRFEMHYHFRQVTFRIAALLFFFLGILMTFGSFGSDEVHPNAPYVINFIICLLSLFTIFVSTLACAAVVLRDSQYNMEPLVFATSIGRLPYCLTRLAGLLGAVFAIMCLAVIGTALGPLFVPDAQPGTVQSGTVHIMHYLAPLLAFGLPSIVFCCSVVFATALLTRSPRYVYAAGVLLFIFYLTASILGNSPMLAGSVPTPGGPGWLSVLLDPFGFTSFFGETANWPAWRRNTKLFPLTPLFLANRLLWTGVSLILLGLAYARFRFRTLPEGGRHVTTIQEGLTAPHLARGNVEIDSIGFGYQMRTFFKVFRLETNMIFGQAVTFLLLVLWVFFNVVEVYENLSNGPYGVRSYATTGILVEQLLAVRPALLLLIFYASEIIHREKANGMQALIFTTPVSKTTFAIAKSCALIAWVIVLMAVQIAIGISVQCFTGLNSFEWGTYLSLYYFAGLPLVLFTILILFIQTIFANKYLGMLVSGLVIAVFIFGRKFGLESYLTRFAITPALHYSDLQGFGHNGLAFHGYMLCWTCLALVLGALAARLWPDGTHDTWRARIRGSIRAFSRPTAVAALLSLVLCIGTGFYIYSKTGYSAHNRTGDADMAWQAQYERQYKRLENTPQPIVTAVDLKTSLFPADHYYTVKGSFRAKNKSNLPISRLWFGVDPDVELTELRPERTGPASTDAAFRQYWFDLANPLKPGDETTVHFAIRVDRSPFKTFNSENAVAENGSYIELEKYLPHFGYHAGYEMEDPRQRRKHGLPPRMSKPSTDNAYHFIDFRNIISTETDQQVVTTGTLEKTWLSDGRKYFQYKSSQPIPYMFALSSARYALETEQYRGTTFRVYYHPGHRENVPAMMLAMKDALDYGNRHFGPYPGRELTLAEIPHYPGSATAYPGVIFSNERTNFRSDFSDSTRFNFTYATTAHETAHQWLAGRVAAPFGPGYALLTESLAKYTEAIVTEKRFGKMYLRPYLLADKHLYFAMRNAMGEKELPLLTTDDQPFVHYQKGGLALYRLKEILGEKRLTHALHALIKSHGYPLSKPRPSELITALEEGASPAQKKLIDEVFRKVIIYDNEIKILYIKQLANNQYQLTLQVKIHKTDETSGKPVAMQPDDMIDIAVFDQEISAGSRLPIPIYLHKHHFSKKLSNITVVTSKHPVTAILDPMSYILNSRDGGF